MIFEPFPKIPRLRRDCTITEKIDGTNAQVCIVEMGFMPTGYVAAVGEYALYAGSRSRWLDTSKTGDNYGFAKWVRDNAADLTKLGPGRHFGEWYGTGIQRGYGLDHKRFALFNTDRWLDAETRPACCDVVPELYRGPFSDEAVESALRRLRVEGSMIATGRFDSPFFPNPEGIIVFMHASRTMHKVTLEKDDAPKGAQ